LLNLLQFKHADSGVRRSIAAARYHDFFQDHILDRPVTSIARDRGNRYDHFLALDQFAEDAMAVVEMQRRPEGDEKLAAVGVRSRVGHGEYAALGVAQVGMKFIVEPIARTAGAVAERVAALNHEARNDPVKNRAVVKRPLDLLAGLGIDPFLGSGRKADEVRHCLWRFLVE